MGAKNLKMDLYIMEGGVVIVVLYNIYVNKTTLAKVHTFLIILILINLVAKKHATTSLI